MDSASELREIYQSYLRSFPEDEVSNLSEAFASLTNDEDRVGFVIETFASRPFEIFLNHVGKDNEKARKIRETGNKKYAASLYNDALYDYTKAIAFAVSDSQELALALGNRAACLLNLGHIAEALVDVQRALAIPAITPEYSDKLLKRQDVCINRIIESKEAVKSHSLPVLRSKSDYFDSTSDKVILADSKEMGRHLVAKYPVITGEILVVEEPYSSVLLPDRFYSHCSACFLRAPSLIECQQCTTAMYCSTECLNKDKKKHGFECKVIEELFLLGMGKMEFLALRILIDALCDGCNIRALLDSSSDGTEDRRGDTYRSLDIHRIYDLIGNTERRPVGDLHTRSFTAFIIVEALKMFTGLFEDLSVRVREVGGFILHFLQSLPCNAHEITQMVEGEGVEIGAGAFATLSLLNHSCEPNVVRQSIGSTVVLRAIRPIRRGEEMVDNYGYHYATHERSERQSSLHRQYYFECSCDACEGLWPLYHGIPSSSPVLKSPRNVEADQKYLQMTKLFEENLELVLAKKVTVEILNSLCWYLDFLDDYLERPWQDFNKCQEAIKFGLNFYHDFDRQ